MSPYPKRPSHFAHSFCRLLFKVCAAQRVGTDGVALLTLIVHTEDAAHYKRAIDFYNVQLAPMLGLSEPALRRTRDRCVKAGWLSYENGGKYQPGTYHVTIPESAKGIDDWASDEGAEGDKASQVKCGADGEPTANRRRSDRQSDAEPAASRRPTDAEPALSNPVPDPVPVPGEKGGPSDGVAFEVSPGVEVDWLQVEAAFMARWNATEGAIMYSRSNIPRESVRDFQERYLEPGWLERAYQALALFPLPNGNKITIGTFLKEGKVDELLGGSNSWKPGRGRASPSSSSTSNREEGERLKEQIRAQRSRNADGPTDRVPGLPGPDDDG
jgi:hypothetical protein